MDIQTYIHTHTHTYIHTCTHTHIYIYMYTHTHTHTHVVRVSPKIVGATARDRALIVLAALSTTLFD